MRLNSIKLELPEIVASNSERFVGRTWLLPHILNWLDKSDQRFFILQGGPGSGKSSILAWLAGMGPLPSGGDASARAQLKKIRSRVKAAHFFMSNTGNTAPRAFAENIAKQLTQNTDKFGDALSVSLAERVQIITKQKVGKAQKVTGIYIGKLDLSGLSDEFSFDRVLRDPLKHLYETLGYDEKIVLLIDALDEALIYRGGTTIVQLLSKLADLPKQVHILVTTRDEPRVLKYFTDIKPFEILKCTPPKVDDVKSYAIKRLRALDNDKHYQQRILADKVSKAARGNFLYAHLVIDDLLKHLPNIKELEKIEFPPSLNGLYHKFLNRELGADEDRWYNTFKPLLGLIAVSQGDGLAAKQLQEMLGRDIDQALRICKQYLQGSLPEGPFRLFHKSFADFLLDETKNIDYHIDAASMHQKIVAYYKGKTLSWEDLDWTRVDDYGLRYLATHAFNLRYNEGYKQELYDLICKPFMEVMLLRFESHQFFIDNVELAIETAYQEDPPNLVQIIRGSLIYGSLGSLATNTPPEVLSALAQLGNIEKARNSADLIQDTKKRSQAYLMIAKAVLKRRDTELFRLLFKQALKTIDSIHMKENRAVLLSQLIHIMAEADQKDLVVQVAEKTIFAIEKLDEVRWSENDIKSDALIKTAESLALIGNRDWAQELVNKLLAATEHRTESETKVTALFRISKLLQLLRKYDRARITVEQAWDAWDELRKAEQTGEYIYISNITQLVLTLIEVGQLNFAMSIPDITAGGSDDKDVALSVLSQALSEQGKKEQAVVLANKAIENVEETRNMQAFVTDEELISIATAFAKVDNFDKAYEILETIPNAESKSAALGTIAQVIALTGKHDEAIKLVNRALNIVEGRPKNTVALALEVTLLSSMGLALIRVGRKEQASKLIHKAIDIVKTSSGLYPRREDGREALCSLVKALAAMKEFETCFKLYPSIGISELLYNVSGALIESGNKDQVSKVTGEIVKLAKEKKRDKDGAIEVIGDVVEILTKCKLNSQALKLTESVMQMLKSFEKEDPSSFAPSISTYTYVAVAKALARTGQFANATKQIELAIRKSEVEYSRMGAKERENAKRASRNIDLELKDDKNYAQLAISEVLVEEYVEAGKGDQAREVALSARNAVITYATLQHLVTAMKVLSSAGLEREAKEIADLALPKAIDELGKTIKGIKTATTSRSYIRTMKPRIADQLEYYLFDNNVVRAYNSFNNAALRVVIVDKTASKHTDLMKVVLEHTKGMPDTYEKTVILSTMAKLLTNSGQQEKGQYILQKALASARLTGRDAVLKTLTIGAPTLAAIDQGQTLWQIYETVKDIESWWSSS